MASDEKIAAIEGRLKAASTEWPPVPPLFRDTFDLLRHVQDLQRQVEASKEEAGIKQQLATARRDAFMEAAKIIEQFPDNDSWKVRYELGGMLAKRAQEEPVSAPDVPIPPTHREAATRFKTMFKHVPLSDVEKLPDGGFEP